MTVIVGLHKKKMRLVRNDWILMSPCCISWIPLPCVRIYMLSFYTVWKLIHFNNPFSNFSQEFMSSSLIYNAEFTVFLHRKIVPYLLLSNLWYSPLFWSFLRGNNGWCRSFIHQVSPSLQWSSSQPGRICVLCLPTYHGHQFSLKPGCSTLSSLKLLVFATEDRQNRNRVVLLSFCCLLSPSVLSREPIPSCLLILPITITSILYCWVLGELTP